MNIPFTLTASAALLIVSPQAAAAPDAGPQVVSTLVSLVLVLAAIGGVALLLRRFTGPRTSQARLMRVVGQLPLGARERINVVELDGQWLVLGVTPQQITLLTQIARKDTGDAAQPSPPRAAGFASLMDQLRAKYNDNAR